MLQKIRNILFFSDLNRSELAEVEPQIMEENRKFCVVWSTVHVLFWTYCLIMSLSDPLYLQCRSIYAVALAVSVVTLGLSFFAASHHSRLIRIIAIVLDIVLLFAGILIACHLAPKTIVVFVAVLIVPVSFITETFSSILILLINIIVFTQIGSRRMDPDTYKWVLSNLCIFSVLGIMIGHFVNRARFERYIFAESNAELARTRARYAYHDQLTDLQNRRAYEETIHQLSEKKPAGGYIVMTDINGLKEMNDTSGHEAGDELIIGAADCPRRSFPETDRIYRIGGDEFCVIIDDGKFDVGNALNRLQTLSTAWKGEYVNGIALSSGFISINDYPDIGAALIAADKKMYASKREYYEKTGKKPAQKIAGYPALTASCRLCSGGFLSGMALNPYC